MYRKMGAAVPYYLSELSIVSPELLGKKGVKIMGYHQLEEVILRSMNDEAFLDLLLVEPEKALREFNLRDEEFKAISTGDEIRLNELLGLGGSTAHINANKYHHSQHKEPTGQKPDLLPRAVTE
jgi:hypothetical protein